MIKRSKLAALLVTSALGVATLASARDANACGGCFVPPGPNTQVTAHRMAFAVSSKRTILWDQIQYVGNPTEFGWVLPIASKVDVGVSSDVLFQRLETETAVQIVGPPNPECPRANRGLSQNDPSAAGTSASDAGSGVDVWSTKVVGPYEATQLSATDGTALSKWLTEHKYVLPPEITPVIDQYIKEKFGFLVIKLVPDADVSRMVPIRIAYDGANPTLPLRMIAAGTGAAVGIKLFVIGEGRWDTKNFTTVDIPMSSLVWDFRTQSSNWGPLEIEAVKTNGGRAFIAESSDEYARARVFSGLPPGTTTPDGGTPVFDSVTDETEIEKAFPGRTNLTLTRFFAELPRSALGTDLELQASTGGKIPRVRTVTNTVNHPCPGSEGGGVFGCAAGGSGAQMFAWLSAGVLGLAGVGFVRRRRKENA